MPSGTPAGNETGRESAWQMLFPVIYMLALFPACLHWVALTRVLSFQACLAMAWVAFGATRLARTSLGTRPDSSNRVQGARRRLVLDVVSALALLALAIYPLLQPASR